MTIMSLQPLIFADAWLPRVPRFQSENKLVFFFFAVFGSKV